jgi:pilus assembly protein CpaC
VTRDLNGLRAALKRALPGADIHVEGLVLLGNVSNPLESQTAFDIASRLVDDGKKVVNGITVHGCDQVMLKVTVAEVQRDLIKQLGVDLNGINVGFGSSVVNFTTDNAFTAFGQRPSNSALAASQGVAGFTQDVAGNLSPVPRVQATLRAMERSGVIRTLAEPSLTAISGESAYFLAGGEFPIPGNYVCDPTTHVCTIQVQFKKFGVGLNFTPVVLSEGRISLKVMSEVSELSNENSLTLLQTNGQTLTIPSVKNRRSETTMEIPSGGSMVMAGMIQEQTKQQINGVPGLMQVPVLGTLFKSRDFVNRQTELMVLVTPYIVRATSRKELSRPDDGFADASDPATILLGRLHRIYGVAGKMDPKKGYRGNYGFILD